MKINTGRGTIPPNHACRHLVCLCIDFLAGVGRVTYFGTAYHHFSTCHGIGYTDAYLPAFAADNSFCAVGGQAGRET